MARAIVYFKAQALTLALQSVSGGPARSLGLTFLDPLFSRLVPRMEAQFPHGVRRSCWVAMEMPDWLARCHAGKPGRLATSVVPEECNGFPGTGVFLRRQARRWTSRPAKMTKTWGIWEPHPTTSTKIMDVLSLMRRLGRSWAGGA